MKASIICWTHSTLSQNHLTWRWATILARSLSTKWWWSLKKFHGRDQTRTRINQSSYSLRNIRKVTKSFLTTEKLFMSFIIFWLKRNQAEKNHLSPPKMSSPTLLKISFQGKGRSRLCYRQMISSSVWLKLLTSCPTLISTNKFLYRLSRTYWENHTLIRHRLSNIWRDSFFKKKMPKNEERSSSKLK
jgi:hypothetical protein